MKWWALIIAVFSITAIATHFQDPGQGREDGIKDILLAIMQTLTTVFVVTLGVTLLGLQFRTQSYTFVGMLEFLNDKTVYSFIFIYIGNIVFITAAVTLHELEPFLNWIVNFSIGGLFFSLMYGAGYVYYMVYKLQPSQIFHDIYKKIRSSQLNEKSSGSDKEFTLDDKPLIMWEDMLIKHNDDFENEFKSIFVILKSKLEDVGKGDNSEKKKNAIKHTMFKSINRVIHFYMNQGNRMIISNMLHVLYNESDYLREAMNNINNTGRVTMLNPFKFSPEDKWKDGLWSNFLGMVKLMIINYDETNFKVSMGIIDSLWKDKEDEPSKIEESGLFRDISAIQQTCILEDRSTFLTYLAFALPPSCRHDRYQLDVFIKNLNYLCHCNDSVVFEDNLCQMCGHWHGWSKEIQLDSIDKLISLKMLCEKLERRELLDRFKNQYPALFEQR